ncbi:MAG: hypothetical protein V7L21_16255 [Nostoc sp.]|uniref:hypothetical protein n=1 Tax=Nostoc sp. TaxID=1180 RepID=UPI002FF87848
MSIGNFGNIYSDELITATELNRQPGRVLDKALERPITITRNDQSFALLRREEVTFLVQAATQSKAVFEVLYHVRLISYNSLSLCRKPKNPSPLPLCPSAVLMISL